MSRRAPNPAAERAAQNQATIKSLLKLEGNKSCADCKRNKHPRWASWNLGVFICIRCSGIHRGMGVHISKVKSVDLDSWTDDQLQSVLKWGNSRANKYWEAKLAPGHVPSEAKIENFIRTKYDSKRWVMDGPIPDPSTLDVDGDDDMPLNLVKEKHNIERSSSQRAAAAPSGPSQIRRAPQPDLFAHDSTPTPRANTASPSTTTRAPPPAEAAPPKPNKPADSLLGLDFFGTASPPPNRPASATATPGATQSRPDLKQSILSLYASVPKPQSPHQPQHIQHGSTGSFNGMQAPSGSSFGGMTDAFGGLSFGGNSASPPAPTQTAKQSAFAGLGNLSSHRSTPSQTSSSASNFGGSFFDTKPAQKPTPPPAQASKTMSSSSGFGAFGSASGATPTAAPASSALGNLFDFSTPALQAAPKQTIASPPPQNTSVFNLSQPQAPTQPKPQLSAAASVGWGNDANAWGSDNAWADPALPKASTQTRLPPVQASPDNFGWGGSGSLATQSIVPGGGGTFSSAIAAPPKVSADDDFGGWSSAAPVTHAATSTSTTKPATGFSSGDDLFSNVWG